MSILKSINEHLLKNFLTFWHFLNGLVNPIFGKILAGVPARTLQNASSLHDGMRATEAIYFSIMVEREQSKLIILVSMAEGEQLKLISLESTVAGEQLKLWVIM